MDVLWQRQKHLHIILQTLPARCWSIADRGYKSVDIASQSSKPLILPVFQFVNSAPTVNEWQRFSKYAARVVELLIGGWRMAKVAPETIAFFGMRSTLDPLWPYLVKVGGRVGLGRHPVHPYVLVPQDTNPYTHPTAR